MSRPRALSSWVVAAALVSACAGEWDGERGPGQPTWVMDGGTDGGPYDGGIEDDGGRWVPPSGDRPPEAPPDHPIDAEGSLDFRYNSESLPDVPCLDGDDATSATFADCETAECFTERRCCMDVGWVWQGGDFDSCADPSECGWTSFASTSETGARLEAPWLFLGGDGAGEAGLYTEPSFGLDGTPTLAFVASLGPDACDAVDGCRQALGVALTQQEAVSAATGVEPSVGLVLDGELEAVHLYVHGRSVCALPVPLEELQASRTYAVRARPDGRIAFWAALPADGAVAVDPSSYPEDFVTDEPAGLRAAEHRIAIWGRLEGERGAAVGGLRVEQWLCEQPDRFDRFPTPVRGPLETIDRAGRPSVTLIPTGIDPPLSDDMPSLLMIYETATGLAAATSWYGELWRFAGDVLNVMPPTQFGRVVRRAPAVVHWGSTSAGVPESYHLWHEGVSELEGPGTAILHATSDDGLHWVEGDGDDSIAVAGDPAFPWRTNAGEPTVVATDTGSLVMWFVGRDPATGRTSIGRASSDDGKEWIVDDVPIRFEPPEPEPFERDGVSQPVVVRRGGVFHMWYAGRAGARAAIGYAVSTDPAGTAFRRAGQVFGADAPWEGRRVAGPAALTLPALEGPGAMVHLWYEAGEPDRESLGWASRRIPAW